MNSYAQVRCAIVLPYRDAAQTLAECLESIQDQTLQDFELLAIDDGSVDSSAAIVAARAEGDPRIRMLANPGTGLVDALNLGLAMASSELVARMDADDRMRPERLARQVAWMAAHPDHALVSSGIRKFPREQLGTGYRLYEQWLNGLTCPEAMADDRYVESPVAHPSVMFRKSIVLESGGYRHGDFPEDYDLWLRMLAAGHHFGRIDGVLLDWRESPERTSRVDPRYTTAAFDRLRARFLARDPRVTQAREIRVWGAGRKSRRRVRLLVEQGGTISGWIDIDPKKIGTHLWGLPIDAPDRLADWLEPGHLLLCYVTNHGAREEIAAYLEPLGFRRGRDYLMVG